MINENTKTKTWGKYSNRKFLNLTGQPSIIFHTQNLLEGAANDKCWFILYSWKVVTEHFIDLIIFDFQKIPSIFKTGMFWLKCADVISTIINVAFFSYVVPNYTASFTLQSFQWRLVYGHFHLELGRRNGYFKIRPSNGPA